MGGCGSSVHHSPFIVLSLFLREAILHLLPQSRRRAANHSPQCTPARRSHVSPVPERIAFSVHNLICKYFILYLKCGGLRNDQCTRFFCRYNPHCPLMHAAVQQSFPVGKYCPQADCSGVPVYHSADCLDSSLLRIVRSVIQLEADFRHLFQCFFLRSVASDQS